MSMMRRLMQPFVLPVRGFCAVFLVLSASTGASAAPEPDAVPSRWEFDVVPGDLRAITLSIPGEGERAFYYWSYEVTNNTGQDRPLTPAFELYTRDGSKGELMRSGRDVPRQATEKIMRKLDDPFLMDEVEVQTGLLLQGPANAREGLVVWPAERFNVDEVVIYAKGFSGETKAITRPDTGAREVLRKTLMLRHQVDGTLDPMSTRPLSRTVERWILR